MRAGITVQAFKWVKPPLICGKQTKNRQTDRQTDIKTIHVGLTI